MCDKSLAAVSLFLETTQVAVGSWRPEPSNFAVDMGIMSLGSRLHGIFKKVRYK